MKKIFLFFLSLLIYQLMIAQQCVTPLNPEPVPIFQQNYSGTTCFENGVLTIESSGYLKMPNKPDPNGYFIWDVPSEVNQIIINANTLVNAGFHYTHGVKITGLDRSTSIIYGTEIVDWNGNLPLNCDWIYMLVWKKGGTEDSEISNITFLNPKTYDISAFQSEGKVDIYNCNFIDKRAGNANNSDGIDAAINSTVQDCYFETKDDNVKILRPNSRVRDCTFRMIENSVPFNIGWGSYSNGASMDATNIRIIGNSGRSGEQNPIIQGGTWSNDDTNPSSVTITMDSVYVNHPNASLVNILNPNQCLNGSIDIANLNIARYWGVSQWLPTYNNCNSMTLCESSPGSINSCSGTQWGGSSVDSYNVPSFAQNFINANAGNHALGRYYNIANVNNTPSSDCTAGCQDDINITTTYNSGTNIDKEANNTITASNIINSGANVDYDAGNEITLVNGFHAKYGCDFHAFIDGCGGMFLINEDNATAEYIDFSDSPTPAMGFLNGNTTTNDIVLRNYPNPFTGTTTIEYTLPQAQEVNLTISNMSGQVIRELKQGELHEAGIHELQFDAQDLPAGVYMSTLQAGTTVQIQKMTLIQ